MKIVTAAMKKIKKINMSEGLRVERKIELIRHEIPHSTKAIRDHKRVKE